MALVIIMNSAIPRLWGVNIASPCYAAAPQGGPIFELVVSLKRYPDTQQNLLAANSGNEHLQKPVGFDVDANFRIRLDFVETLNDVAVTVQHVTLDCAVAVGDRLATRKLAACFDIHVHRWRFDERGVDGHADCERIIHRRT